MGTEFERLMRLAEQNTVDIQRMSLQRKRQTISSSTLDKNAEAESREKRRKLELQQRVRHRETEEKLRQERMQAALEKRQQEKIENNRAEEARRRQAQQQRVLQKQQQQQQQQQQKRSNGTTNTHYDSKGVSAASKSKTMDPRRSTSMHSSRNGNSSVAAAPATTKKQPTQPLSYEQLMRIASGKAAIPPVKTEQRAHEVSRSPSRISSTSSESHGRTRRNNAKDDDLAPIRHPTVQRSRPRDTAPAHKETLICHGSGAKDKRIPNALTGGCSSSQANARLRKPVAPPSPTSRPVKPAKTNSAPMHEGSRGGSKQHASQLPSKAPTVSASASCSASAPREYVRREPVREIDRFGVRPGSARPRPVAKGTMPRDYDRAATNGRDDRRERQPSTRSQYRSDGRTRDRDPRSIPAYNSYSRASSRKALPPPRGNGYAARPDRGRDRNDDDYESEYDSLDDFIVDDEDEPGGRYRVGAIREMLGVKYHDVDDDDDDYNMESSATQQMSEERRSARIGRMEDAEEERRLAEEERERERRRQMRERRG